MTDDLWFAHRHTGQKVRRVAAPDDHDPSDTRLWLADQGGHLSAVDPMTFERLYAPGDAPAPSSPTGTDELAEARRAHEQQAFDALGQILVGFVEALRIDGLDEDARRRLAREFAEVLKPINAAVENILRGPPQT